MWKQFTVLCEKQDLSMSIKAPILLFIGSNNFFNTMRGGKDISFCTNINLIENGYNTIKALKRKVQYLLCISERSPY